ncbi:DinB family protein [compost metagenome]
MKEQLLETLGKAKKYTLAVADAMPATDYIYKPEGAGWNFIELLNHIGYGVEWWKENFLLGNEKEWLQPVLKMNKVDTINYLNQVFQDFEKNCLALPLINDMEIYGFHATLDHITHHRGQAVTYLRCKGITPPEYIY